MELNTSPQIEVCKFYIRVTLSAETGLSHVKSGMFVPESDRPREETLRRSQSVSFAGR